MGEDKESVTITAEPDDVQETAAVPRGDSKHAGSAVQGSTKRRMARDMSHKLTSTRKGESAIEYLAKKIETRRANRIPVTFPIRKQFLHICREAAKGEGQVNRMSAVTLKRLRDEYKEKVKDRETPLTETRNSTGKLFGFWDEEMALLEVLDAACDYVEEVEGSWFFYRDFNYYNTVVAHRIRLFRNPVAAASVYLLLFYLGSAILFCPIMNDPDACPNRESYDGWLTAVYFASVTMSTVGYGDVNLSGGPNWRTFIGTIYMLVAMGFAYTVFSTAASAALDKAKIDRDGEDIATTLFHWFCGSSSEDISLPLYQRVRRVTCFRVFELAFWFACLNLLGVFVARGFINASDDEAEEWDWMTTFYWAIQTTTTIGYGDLNMPFDMRWFQIFFTTFGTAFVGAVFGAAAGLQDEIADIRRFYAWKRREVSKQLVEEMQGSNADDKVDQYEFMLASLLMLNKISCNDVEQIMDKYRELAGDKGYILGEDLTQQAVEAAERDDREESKAAHDEDMKIDVCK